MKNVLKGLVIGMIVIIGCLVNGMSAKAETINNYNVEVMSISHLDNSITIQKDNDLYKFYVDDPESYYLSEYINVTMDNDEIVDCSVVDEPIIYSNIEVVNVSSDLVYINVNGELYSFDNEDNSWYIDDKVNVVMQNDRLLEVKSIG